MKKVKEGYKMSELGEIPIEWQIKSINDICYVNPDTLSNKSDDSLFLEYIDIESVTTRRINEIKKLEFKDAPSRARRLIKRNDVIMSTVRPYLKAFAKINIEKDNLVCSTGFAVLRAKKNINHEFLFQSILSDYYIQQLSNKMVGSNYPAVNSSDVRESNIILPPLEEQEKIASILSTVDEQIDNVDALIEKNKELKKGLMQTLLTKGIGHTKFKKTEVGEIPEEWTLVKIGDVAKFQAGYAFKSSDYVDNGVKLVKITNVQQKDLLWNDTDFLPEEFLNKYKEYSLEINDVIIAMTRPIISSGIKICKVKKEDTPALLNQRVGRFITSENVNNKYLYQYCFSNYFINKVNELCSTTGQPNISSNQLESIMISLPSTEEQEKIGSILLNVDEKMEEYENKKQRLEELKKGLMQQLLTGNIRII